MNIPKDAYMLLSFINTKLRDEFDSLDSFCKANSLEISEIEQKLENIGYKYNKDTNQFIVC